MKKSIKVGEYEFGYLGNNSYSHNSSGGTNNWDKLIEKNGFANKKLEVILRPVRKKR